MALLFHDDDYDLRTRQTGFRRYRQLLSFYGFHWWKVGMLTLLGSLPLVIGIVLSVLYSSLLILLPASLLGGMILGPFLAALYDAVMRGLRYSPDNQWRCYLRSWKQNGKASLLPGALLGLLLGSYAFMFYVTWMLNLRQDARSVIACLLSGLLLILINTLYWPQLVLFELSGFDRIRNIILFSAKYFWRVLGVTLLQLFYWGLYLLFAPWSLLLLPLLGVWFIVFLSELLLYDCLDAELKINERFLELEGAPFEDETDTENPDTF